MKKNITVLTLFLLVSFASATVSFTGTALQNAVDLAVGQRAIILIDEDSGDAKTFSSLSSLAADASVTDSSTYDGFTVIGDTTSSSFLGNTRVSGSAGPYDNVSALQNNEFAILVFEDTNTTTSTIAGDTFRIWVDASWLSPSSNSGTFSFGSGGDFAQLSNGPDFTGTVVPEPSTYAAILGLLALGAVWFKRRK